MRLAKRSFQTTVLKRRLYKIDKAISRFNLKGKQYVVVQVENAQETNK